MGSILRSICKPQFGRETTLRDFDEYYKATKLRVRSWDSVGLLLDYGHCMTIHKSQGSSWEHVVVVADFPRMMNFDLKKRTLYTAITRAERYLAVLT